MENKSIEFNNDKKVGKFLNEYFISQESDPHHLKILKFTARWSVLSAIVVWGIIGYGVLTHEKNKDNAKKTEIIDTSPSAEATFEDSHQ